MKVGEILKHSNLIVALLVVLIVGAWATTLLNGNSAQNEEYQNYIELAEDYMSRGLYQKAIEQYDLALVIDANEEIWTWKLAAYALRYEEDDGLYSQYVAELETAIKNYSDNGDFVYTAANLYMEKSNYSDAYKVLNNALQNGVEDKYIESMIIKAQYAYKYGWGSYNDYISGDGFYAVQKTETWSYIDSLGSTQDYDNLTFAGPVGSEGIFVIADENGNYIVNSSEVIEGFLDFVPVSAGIFSEGLVAISNGSSYSYYNSFGEKQFGQYEEAGAFVNGEAAVKENGKWYIIDTNGDAVDDETYVDIIIGANGSHITNNVMIAMEKDEYEFYSGNDVYGGYSQVDIITDDGIVAVCENGKWGFVNLEGEEIIGFDYEGAKSFSNGLAAVYNGELWGFINLEGTMAIEYTFTDADYFNQENYCMVQTLNDEDLYWKLISLYVG